MLQSSRFEFRNAACIRSSCQACSWFARRHPTGLRKLSYGLWAAVSSPIIHATCVCVYSLHGASLQECEKATGWNRSVAVNWECTGSALDACPSSHRHPQWCAVTSVDNFTNSTYLLRLTNCRIGSNAKFRAAQSPSVISGQTRASTSSTRRSTRGPTSRSHCTLEASNNKCVVTMPSKNLSQAVGVHTHGFRHGNPPTASNSTQAIQFGYASMSNTAFSS